MSFMVQGLIETLISVVYPTICVGCKKPNHNKESNLYLCDECYLDIKRHAPPFCLKCGRGLREIKNISSSTCSTCLGRKYYFDRAWSICSYEGILKELIHSFKYNQKLQYRTIFEKLLKEFLGAFKILGEIDLIIPIALHPVRLREREYNQSQILSSIIGNIISKPISIDILERIRNTKPQIDLNEQARIKNIEGCFRVKNMAKLKSKSILLVDDVLTTGTTLSEAARTINEFKPHKIYALTMAS